MNCLKYLTVIGILLLAACQTSSPFFSSWKAPDAEPLHYGGAKVAAVVMTSLEGSRRAAEDVLARELTARGAEGIPLYMILPDATPGNEEQLRDALEKEGIEGVVVMRPVETLTKVKSTPSMYGRPPYSSFYGGYCGYGWSASWDAMEIRTDTIVYVETMVYSLKQNKLVWGGQSKTTNPSTVDRLITDTAKKVAAELDRLGLLAY